MLETIAAFLFLPFLVKGQPVPVVKNVTKPLAVREFSLNNRYQNSSVNDVFKDNILLTLDYVRGVKVNPAKIDWDSIRKPFVYTLVLKPNETFAFHDDVLPEYKGKVNKTTNAHFNSTEGFKSDGYLVGDGICHLASLLYWVARDAGLRALAPTRHDFARIPDVPREYGVSIYAYPGSQTKDQVQNLYITNNKGHEIAFRFSYDGGKLKITASETL